MKRTYSPRHNIASLVSELSWGARVLSFVVVLLVVRLASPATFFSLMNPVLTVGNSTSQMTRTLLSSFTSAMVLSTERDALKVEIARLRTENDSQKQELSQLRDAAGLHAAVVRMTPGITAIVIARPPQSPYDTLLIAEGSKTGVRVGMEAFAQTGAPVGVVTSVNDDYAFVTLFSSYGRETAGWIGAKALPVSLVGSGGGTFGAEITRPADVAVGDRVYVPGPGMLAIGSIARIDDDPSQPSLVLRVVPAANFFSLTSVVLRDTGYADTFLRSATSTSL